MPNQAAVIALVVPCYNESVILENSARTLSSKLDEMTASGLIDASSMILMADDGSTDGTW